MSKRTIRLGMAGYVKIMAALRDKPRTTGEMVADGLLGRTAAGRVITSLHHLGYLSIVGWRQAYRCVARPIFGCVTADDVPPPAERPNGRPACAAPLRKLVLSPEVVALASMLTALEDPLTKTEIMAATGLSYGGMQRALEALRRHGFVRIAGWERRDSAGGPPMPQFQRGSERDAQRPQRASKKARNQRYNARRRERSIFTPLHLAIAGNQPTFNLAQCA